MMECSDLVHGTAGVWVPELNDADCPDSLRGIKAGSSNLRPDSSSKSCSSSSTVWTFLLLIGCAVGKDVSLEFRRFLDRNFKMLWGNLD